MPAAVSSTRKASPSLSQESTPVPLSSTTGQPAPCTVTPSIRVVIPPKAQTTAHVTTAAEAVIVRQEWALIATTSVDEAQDGEPELTPDHGHGTRGPPPFTHDAQESRTLLGVPEPALGRNSLLSASSMVDDLDAYADAKPRVAGTSVEGLIMSSIEEGEVHEHEKEAGGHVNRAGAVSAGAPLDGAHEESDACQSVCA